ncbi:MAG: bacillithiol biosynthesis BshC [Acidobacteria bacterium]|nr:bacillithiol biosynthesis BshC [Acidobacteriota bacterium]
MRCTRIPYTELPGTSALFGDYLNHFERTARFYSHDPRDLESLRRSAAAVRLGDGRRQQLAAALRRTNGETAALAQLELPDTVAVVTGQQVGLYSGPAYTIYKALTAVRLARMLSDSGARAVPVFWLATEDHDLDEIDHAWLFDNRQQPVKLSAQAAGKPGAPVGGIEITAAPIDELAASLRGFLYADEVLGLVEECYRPGRTLGQAFRELLQRLLAGYGLIFLDPLDPAIRSLAAPFLADAYQRRDELLARLLERGRELQQAGYHAQVLVDSGSSLFFRLENGRRVRIPSGAEAGDPATLSPNALLRPVMQDFLLPTAAYVGGPAEIAYFAQSQVLYQELLGRMPLAVPRAGFTLLDERARSLMARFAIPVHDCFHGETRLKERISARLIPESLEIAFEDVTSEVRNSIDRLYRELHTFDPTLGDSLTRSRGRILYQLDKNRRKAAREALRRDKQVDASASHLSNLVFPEKHLQERLYTILPFLARHGFDLMDTLFENVQPGCLDHQLLAL